ncbi:MAG: efflux RND transporter periplasmic adaptor subunit [Pseudomonadota bacterium]
MSRKLYTILGTLGIILFGAGLITLMSFLRPEIERTPPKKEPPTVLFDIAEPAPVRLNVYAQGEVRPQTDITLTAQVAGRVVVTADNFVNGGAFKAGDVLATIEDADYRVALAGARASLAQANEALKREEAEGALAEQDYKDLGLGEEASALTLRKPQLAQARANYAAAAAEVTAAKLNLDRTKIFAPFDGRVRERISGPGQYVAPGSQIGRVFATDIVEVRLPLTDADLEKLGLSIAFVETPEMAGPDVVLRAPLAGIAHEWKGRIARTDGAIDPTTRQISAIAVVEDPYGAGADQGAPLAVGLFVDAEITGRPYPSAFVLPRTALYGRDRVYVVGADDRIAARQVNVVATARETITVGRGLRSGEKVVTSPLRGAGDGDQIVPIARETIDMDASDPAPAIANAPTPAAFGGETPRSDREPGDAQSGDEL